MIHKQVEYRVHNIWKSAIANVVMFSVTLACLKIVVLSVFQHVSTITQSITNGL